MTSYRVNRPRITFFMYAYKPRLVFFLRFCYIMFNVKYIRISPVLEKVMKRCAIGHVCIWITLISKDILQTYTLRLVNVDWKGTNQKLFKV